MKIDKNMIKVKFNWLVKYFILSVMMCCHNLYAGDVGLKSVVSVNDNIITNYDVDIRLKFISEIIKSSQSLQQSFKEKYNQNNIQKNIITDLINENLKITEAKRYGINATEADIKQGIMITASKFGMEEKQLENILSKIGCQKDIWVNNKINVCYQMFFADIVWARFAGMFFSSQLTNSDKEIEEEVKKYTEYVNFVINDLNISQIILKNKQDAENIYNKIKDSKGCSHFNSEIKKGLPGSGSLGFIKLYDTSKLVGEHLKKLPTGTISKPLKNTDNKYYLYIICDKKIDTNLEKKIIPIQEMKTRISNAIVNNKLEAFAKKHLEKLFNSAFIEYM